ncbi:phospholipase D-like domain-containing protein [Sporolactobacillus shoreicorticis]|uniref:Phosphatidylserine/phosphatidylglycerophosphate/ cardiolipin synthase family protein n=1 Tax=Sporolactobacillus shoreicorticis TaxID=1923877 RepID=A0ABW5S7P3_9BACL|nr:phospholipase D-like domain-containing protein [Sporolactobacillus shoreicorticis]MCO7125593.1 phospholipase D-like domain-containing protein [Sporolactobacillus shoreicorticis]
MHFLLALLIIILVLVVLISAAIWLDIRIGLKVKRPLIHARKAVTGFNRFRYFTNGHELFKEMKQTIESARHHIHLSFFIFVADEVGSEWLELLKKKAEEGVEVRLLVDALSSFALRKKRAELVHSGVQLAFSEKPMFPFTFYFLNRRNHRKLMIIDGKFGYFGGFNVSRDYIGRNSKMGPWHDNHLKIEGESVPVLQRLFIEDWQRASKTDLPNKDIYFPNVTKGPSPLALIGTDGKQLEDYFAKELSSARTSIYIASPYFVPSKRLLNVLLDRMRSGVAVTILLPQKKDHPLVQPASFLYLEPLVKRGAKLFHFYQGFYHSKLFVIDRNRCYLGTANFDQRSLFWNSEFSGFTTDPGLVHQALHNLEKEIKDKSVAVTLQQIRKRSPFAKLSSRCSGWFSFFL